MTKLVYGFGTNDADYVVNPSGHGTEGRLCPFYSVWAGMLERAYSAKCKVKNPTYLDVTVCEEWHRFSVFKAWMEQQDWEGKQLDKDILIVGNKVYGPETCCFVDKSVNSFLTDSKSSRGEWPIGVSYHKMHRKFQARCRNPSAGKSHTLGYYSTPSEAHLAWAKYKLELAKNLAKNLPMNIGNALIKRFELIRQSAEDALHGS